MADELYRKLQDLADGELGPAEAAEGIAYTAAHPEAGEVHRGIVHLKSLIKTVASDVELPPDLPAAISAALDAEVERSARSRARFLMYAAAALILSAAGLVFYFGFLDSSTGSVAYAEVVSACVRDFSSRATELEAARAEIPTREIRSDAARVGMLFDRVPRIPDAEYCGSREIRCNKIGAGVRLDYVWRGDGSKPPQPIAVFVFRSSCVKLDKKLLDCPRKNGELAGDSSPGRYTVYCTAADGYVVSVVTDMDGAEFAARFKPYFCGAR